MTVVVRRNHARTHAPGPSGAAIAVTGVGMMYATPAGTVRALDDVTLTVEPGASVAVVGPSGCGKSTLLGLVGGLDVPTAGEVRVDGHALSAMPERARARFRRRTVGFVFQADNLQEFLTVSENVALQAVLAGVADEPDHRQALLDALGVGRLAHRFPDQLSGGQRQRVAIARALVHLPRVVLADEPTGALDGTSAAKAIDLLAWLQRQKGTTLVVASHDPSVAARMDAVVEMRDGRIVGTAGIPS